MTVSLPVMQRGVSRQCTAIHGTGPKTAAPRGTGSYSRRALDTDALGTFALTLTHLAIGSAIQIQSESGVTLHNSVATTTNQLINLQAYGAGSPLNSLVVKVRKGSGAPFYQPFETFTTAIVGAQSIYVSQIEDQ